jgi:predicted ABC-type ATPase
MRKPELVFVVGPNAAGKSSFIRTRLDALQGFEVIMTDVYKGRTKEIFTQALTARKDIILETVFNDSSFKNLVDEARHAGYHTSLVVLFLDNPQHSLERVAFRSTEQSGLIISGSNIRINFNESFKNVATYYFYFDQSDFIYTGITGKNQLIMSFQRSLLTYYQENPLQYPQKFADYGFLHERLSPEAHQLIKINETYKHSVNDLKANVRPGSKRRFKI